MNLDQENFEALRKLLALKKYEQPPPRYFSELSTRIWARIEREPQATSFWERLFPNFGLSPALAYSFGLLACGTLVFGISYSLNTDSEQIAARPIGDTSPFPSQLATKETPALNLSNYQVNQLASTNPVMNSEQPRSLFNGLNLRVEPVNYSPGQ
ncbi:MAG: hypothetical protein ABIR24_13255 [Verrucomicrobiota bacterium]